MKALEDERDHYKREFERVKLSSNVPEKDNIRHNSPSRQNRSPVREKVTKLLS